MVKTKSNARKRERAPKREPAALQPQRLHQPVMHSAKALRQELRRQRLATATTASTNDLAAARGCLAREETVPTGTHEIAGLESPLHIILE